MKPLYWCCLCPLRVSAPGTNNSTGPLGFIFGSRAPVVLLGPAGTPRLQIPAVASHVTEEEANTPVGESKGAVSTGTSFLPARSKSRRLSAVELAAANCIISLFSSSVLLVISFVADSHRRELTQLEVFFGHGIHHLHVTIGKRRTRSSVLISGLH